MSDRSTAPSSITSSRAVTTTSLPAASLVSNTDAALPSNYDFDDDAPSRGSAPPSSGILNYYFLLLAILIFIVFIAYYTISRRRKRNLAQLRSTGQNALARDLEGWPGSRRGTGSTRRWRGGRVEEGLDERGEPPPPYVHKVPEGAVLRDGGESGVPLRDLGGERKPPDYQEQGLFR